MNVAHILLSLVSFLFISTASAQVVVDQRNPARRSPSVPPDAVSHRVGQVEFLLPSQLRCEPTSPIYITCQNDVGRMAIASQPRSPASPRRSRAQVEELMRVGLALESSGPNGERIRSGEWVEDAGRTHYDVVIENLEGVYTRRASITMIDSQTVLILTRFQDTVLDEYMTRLVLMSLHAKP